MNTHAFPVIDLIATGDNIRRLRLERGLSVRDLQMFFGFEQPQAIYKWQKGACLPTVDNLYALGSLFGVPMDQILVPVATALPSYIEQQAEACCSHIVEKRVFDNMKGILALIALRLVGARGECRARPKEFFRRTCRRKNDLISSRLPRRELCETFVITFEQQAEACCSLLYRDTAEIEAARSICSGLPRGQASGRMAA